MPKRKDIWVIVAVLVVAGAMVVVSRLLPKSGLEGRTAEATLAPDAVEYLEATPQPQTETTDAPVTTDAPEATDAPEMTDTPETTDAPDDGESSGTGADVMGPMPAQQTQEIRGYVVITVGGRQYGDPIAMDRDKIITIKQEDGKINKVHITPQEVYMESSTCENQDCVGQGAVDVDTYAQRILGTYIICLPNEVVIEMVPAE